MDLMQKVSKQHFYHERKGSRQIEYKFLTSPVEIGINIHGNTVLKICRNVLKGKEYQQTAEATHEMLNEIPFDLLIKVPLIFIINNTIEYWF